MTQTIHPADLVPLHDVDDRAKVATLVTAMQADGWTGAPIVVIAGQDVRAITGVHRRAAALIADIKVPIVDLDDILTEHDTSLSELTAEYGDEYEALARLPYHLPAEVIEAYGIDVQ